MTRHSLGFWLIISVAAHSLLLGFWSAAGEPGSETAFPVPIELLRKVPAPANRADSDRPSQATQASSPPAGKRRTSARPPTAPPLPPAVSPAVDILTASAPSRTEAAASAPPPLAGDSAGAGHPARVPTTSAGEEEKRGKAEENTVQPAAGEIRTIAIPRYEHNPPPSYPRLARDRGWAGEVLLLVRVAASGKVLEVRLGRSSGHAVLDRSAIESVRHWKFRPGRQGERPVESEVAVPVNYVLEGS